MKILHISTKTQGKQRIKGKGIGNRERKMELVKSEVYLFKELIYIIH